MQSYLTVIEPAGSGALLSTYEARLGLNVVSSTDETLMDQIDMIVEWSSGEIATLCNRTFAKQKVAETFRDLYGPRLFLSCYPITAIDSVVEDGVTLSSSDYDIDAAAGCLIRLGGDWGSVVVVTNVGGYELPNEAPVALRRATLLVAREAYYATTRGDATIRMISHKDSRVIYFDPNAKGGAGGSPTGMGGSASNRAISDLLKRYMRFNI